MKESDGNGGSSMSDAKLINVVMEFSFRIDSPALLRSQSAECVNVLLRFNPIHVFFPC